MAEKPGAIEACFRTLELNPRGKYRLRLFDPSLKEWVNITIDDQFPCDEHSRPLFSNSDITPATGELWVMLLEKAFAKMRGSYANLEGGYALFAMACITGDDVIKYQQHGNEGKFEQLNIVVERPDDNTTASAAEDGLPRHKVKFVSSDDYYDKDQLWQLMKSYDKKGCIIAAGSAGEDHTRVEGRGEAGSGGIVPGHAYTVLKVRECHGHKLLCLRNPWGSFEWKGDWSDNSDMWQKHKLVKLQLWYR